MTTFTLGHLEILFDGKEGFQASLSPYHEVRADGVFVKPEWHDANHRQIFLSAAVRLCPPGVDILSAVLPPQFTEPELLTFLTLRPDMAWEIEHRYTNNRPKCTDVTTAADVQDSDRRVRPAAAWAEDGPHPLDEEALSELEATLPSFAELLRRRLPMGNHWNTPVDLPIEPLPASTTVSTEQARSGRRAAWTPERRSELLNDFRALEGKRPSELGKGKRGALMRLAEKSGVDKDSLADQLDKAIEEKRAADMWTQLNPAK